MTILKQLKTLIPYNIMSNLKLLQLIVLITLIFTEKINNPSVITQYISRTNFEPPIQEDGGSRFIDQVPCDAMINSTCPVKHT